MLLQVFTKKAQKNHAKSQKRFVFTEKKNARRNFSFKLCPFVPRQRDFYSPVGPKSSVGHAAGKKMGGGLLK